MGGRNNKLKDQKGLDQKGSGRQRNPPKEILPRVKRTISKAYGCILVKKSLLGSYPNYQIKIINFKQFDYNKKKRIYDANLSSYKKYKN